MPLPANWVDGGPSFYAANENAVEAAVNALSAYTPTITTYTAQAADNVLSADATTGSFTITLPTAVGIAGKQYTVKKVDYSVNTVTIATTSSQTIDGSPTAILVFTNHFITVVSNGANWLVIEHNYAGTMLGYAEVVATGATTNSTVTSAALAANTLPGLAITTVGAGRAVTIMFQGQGYNTTANAQTAVQLLTNSVSGAGCIATTASTTIPVGMFFRANPILTAGTSYTFTIGMWCQSGTTGVYYADNYTPTPTSLSVVGA